MSKKHDDNVIPLKTKKSWKLRITEYGGMIFMIGVLLVAILVNVSTGKPLEKAQPSDNATTTAPLGETIHSSDTAFKLSNKTVHLYGKPIKVGDVINTNYELDTPTATIDKESTTNLSTLDKKWRVIETVPSIDSPVCSLQTKILGVLAEHNKNVNFITVSQDLPFAQNRYKQTQKLSNLHLFSDYRGSFSKDNHLLIKETQLNARVIMVVDPNNTVKYIQYAHDEVAPLDLDKAMKVVKDNQQ